MKKPIYVLLAVFLSESVTATESEIEYVVRVGILQAERNASKHEIVLASRLPESVKNAVLKLNRKITPIDSWSGNRGIPVEGVLLIEELAITTDGATFEAILGGKASSLSCGSHSLVEFSRGKDGKLFPSDHQVVVC